MTCRPCSLAQSDPTRDEFAAGCDGCKARALAAIGAHVESQALGVMTPGFRETLERVFGDVWRQQAPVVRDWGQKVAAARKSAVLLGLTGKRPPEGAAP